MLEQVTQLTSGSSQSVVHAPVVGVKTGSAERALHTVARAPLLHAFWGDGSRRHAAIASFCVSLTP